MKRYCLLTVVLFVLAGYAPARANDVCLDCHEKKTPGIVGFWRQSAHARKNVSCTDCHGTDPEACHNRTVVVDAARCGRCHARALNDHRLSKHGIADRAGRACTRTQPVTPEQKKSCSGCHEPSSAGAIVKTQGSMFLAQSPEMQRQGCGSCHHVELQCSACHTKHGTDLAAARDPATCGTCHMGPDHPQLEMWETSRHGVLFRQTGAETGPSCVTCHMPGGSHNVSRGIGAGLRDEREFMLAICSRCHTKSFSQRSLADADGIRNQSNALVKEAEGIVAALGQDGLLVPSPLERPGHPLLGKTLVTGPQMLYENLSFVEALFFKMKTFYAPTAYKGAYHQNPDYAHWYGNAPLKLALSEIKSTADLLRSVDLLQKRLDNAQGTSEEGSVEFKAIQEKLRSLNDQRLRQEITEQEYLKRKKKILDEHGL
jgi:hydroxylamine dehydrogenase